MATPPDPFSSSLLDPASAEAAASQITSASLTSYGKMPNPQAVYEAIASGSTPAVTAAITAGDPQYQSLLASSPAGGQPRGYGNIGQVTDPNQSLWSFDWGSYWKGMHDNLSKDENSSWRSFGATPELNFEWMNGVRGNSKPDDIKKWQHLLQGRGFMDSKYQVGGVWDKDTETAFQGFMISQAMPEALFQKDPTKRANANMFLNGLGVDANALDQKIGHDPTFAGQVAQQWMAAQGPDSQNQQGGKHLLQVYADRFGVENLPQSYQAIVHEGFLETIRNGLDSLPLIGDIPVVGGAYHGLTNVLTGNLDFSHLTDDPRKTKAAQIEGQLTATDKKLLQPALDQVKNSAGFLGFMDDYDHTRTKFLLSMIYTIGDTVTGKYDSTKDNPFDPMSGNNLLATAHQDNFAAGIFGDNWAKDHNVVAGFTNFAVNTLDDPTSYLPLLGQLHAVERWSGARTAAKAIGNDKARELFTTAQVDGIRRTVNQSHFAGMRELATSGKASQADMIRAFGIRGTGDEAITKIKYMQKFLDPKMDEHSAWDLFQNGDDTTGGIGFGYLMNSPKGMYNFHAAWKSLPLVKEQGMLGRFRTIGGFMESPIHFGRTDPIQLSDHLSKMAYIAKMKPEESKGLLDNYLKAAVEDPNQITATFHAAIDKIHEAYFANHKVNKEAFTSYVERHRSGRTIGKTYGDQAPDRVNLMMPDPTAKTKETATEVSTGASRANQEALKVYQNDLAMAQEKNLPPEMINQIQNDITRMSRSTPFLETQLADQLHTSYSLYEMVSYANPVLRNIEKVTAAMHIDAVNQMWKRITIGRISSAFRITLGDDAIRPAIQLAATGHIVASGHYLVNSILKSAGLLVPGTRKRVAEDTLKKIEESAAAGRDIRPLLQEVGRYVQEGSTDVFHPFLPNAIGYHKALTDIIHNHLSKSKLTQAWLKDGKAGLEDVVKNSTDPEIVAWREAQGATSAADLNNLVQRGHDVMTGIFRDPDVKAWTVAGKVDSKALEEKVRKTNMADTLLPTIPGRLDSPYANAMIQHWISAGPNWVFEHMTKPMIDNSRVNGYIKMKQLYERQVREYHKDFPGRAGDAWEKTVDQESHARALDWMLQNTYQGTRSVMGGALRTVMPFYGATANMDRFWMRQAASAPFIGSMAAHTAVESQRASLNQNQAGMTGLEGILSHLGFGGGEGVQFNPMHAFFLTSDGFGSFVPGTGPIFAPIWNAISHNPGLAETLKDIPGFSQQIDFNTGLAKPMFPWLADLISGTGMAVTGQNVNVPILGRSNDQMNKAVDDKVKQRERNGDKVTAADLESIRREVGRDLMLGGALSFTAPVTPQVIDVEGQKIKTAVDEWRQAPNTAAKDTTISSQLGISMKQWQDALASGGVGDLIKANPQSAGAQMAYLDRRVSPEERDVIAQAAPWVVSGATSEYQTLAGHPTDLAQWQVLRSMGDVRLIHPDEYVNKIASERDINTAWLSYDALKNDEFQQMATNGWTTASQGYKDWKASVFDPAVIQLENTHPEWAKSFGSQQRTDAPGLAEATRPLRTLSTWEVIPQHSDYEKPQSILWRNALLFRDQAAAAINEIHSRRGSKSEQDAVMQGLQTNLQQLAALDPSFAADIGQFRFGNWMDVVNLQADELKANALGG